jgi:hypothetical protein
MCHLNMYENNGLGTKTRTRSCHAKHWPPKPVMQVFHVKLHVWRAKEYFRIIDRAAKLTGIQRRLSAKSAPRVKSTVSRRTPVPSDLLKKIYDPEWLSKQERERPFYVQDDLRISEDVFDLLVLAIANV